MSEFEDAILPDDFEMPTEVETVEDTTPTEETEVEAPETTEEEPEVQETGIIDPNFKLNRLSTTVKKWNLMQTVLVN
jgi:hypothetical protein